jgi:hypothetical protein
VTTIANLSQPNTYQGINALLGKVRKITLGSSNDI